MRPITVIVIALLSVLGSRPTTAELAPDFPIPARAGAATLQDLRGRVVYLDFWASWCTPCRKSFPWMNEMAARYADQGLEIISVNLDKERALAEKFLREMPASFVVVYDPAGRLAEQYGLIGMPTSYLIDRRGEVRQRHVGFHVRSQDAYESEIQQLLREMPINSATRK